MRQPAVADRFYPGSREALTRTVTELLAKAGETNRQKALAVVCPHAGYVYSGALAAATLACVEIPETVIIIGPNHRGQGAPAALSTIPWNMPLGTIPIDLAVCEQIQGQAPGISVDELAHRYEHSLEVQVPFLQMLQKNLKIVPLVLAHGSYAMCKEIAGVLARVIQGSTKNILIVASSDMNHYESRINSEIKDKQALHYLLRMEPEKLYSTVLANSISMCGVIPVVIAILAAQHLGGRNCRLVGYTDSGYVSGDTEQVVGYAGVVIN